MKKAIAILLLFIITCSGHAHAQMFSVSEQSQQADPFAPYIRVGVKSLDFTYKGNPQLLESNTPPFEFSGMALTAEFETSGFDLALSLGNDISGLKSKNYFDLGISFMNPFYIVRQRTFLLGIPIQLSSVVTTIRTDDSSEEFAQTNLSAGAGLIAQLHIPNVLGSTLQIIPNYGFSTSSGGFIGGSVITVAGKARLNFYNLIFGKNLSVGYDYTFNSYNIDDKNYDYNFNGHAVTLGISF